MNTFSVGESISFGFNTFKKRGWFFVGVTVLVGLVGLVLQGIGYIPVVGVFVSFVGSVFLAMGRVRFYLAAHDRVEAAELSDWWKAPHPFWKFIGANLLASLITMGPAIVALILIGIGYAINGVTAAPGSSGGIVILLGVLIFIVAIIFAIVASIWLLFIGAVVMDKNMRPVAAIKESVRITEGNRWKLFGLCLALGGINILGVCALIVGVFVTLPVTVIAFMHAYRKLEHQRGEVVPALPVA